MQTLGQKIKELRKEKGLTQIQLAEKLNVNKSTIAKYETDKIEPSLLLLKQIAIFFDVSADYLLGIKEF